jgi:Putative Actinobacterial Holin-X, holin superfamily III
MAEVQGNTTTLKESVRSDRSVPELMRELSDQTATLVRQELDLAKAEVTAKGKKAGLGAGMFGGASLFGIYALGALTACAILALATAMAGWLAALIVAAIYGLIAGVLALNGARNVKRGVPPTPEQTVQSLKEDVEWTKLRAQEGRR